MNNQPTNLSETVLKRIEREQVSPTSRSWFFCCNVGMQFAWLLAVLIGALAVAILLYVGAHGWFGFYEATERSRIGLVIAYVPVLWVLVLLSMVLLAYQNLRHTKRGYRYPVWVVVGTSLFASMVGGAVFYTLGFGHFVDMQLGQQMPMYSSYYKQQELFWQTPVENRWLGVVDFENDVLFADVSGERWQLDTSQLTEAELDMLMVGERVRLLGIGGDDGIIMVCGVFPWREHVAMQPRELANERTTLIERLEQVKQASSSCSRMGVLDKMP